jgi:hypothetical protein
LRLAREGAQGLTVPEDVFELVLCIRAGPVAEPVHMRVVHARASVLGDTINDVEAMAGHADAPFKEMDTIFMAQPR